MKLIPALSLLSITAISLAACDRKEVVVVETAPATPVEAPTPATRTMETSRLARAVSAFERNPTAENSADVKQAIAELDREIAELEVIIARQNGSDRDEAAAKAKNLKTYRASEVARFTAAQAGSALAPRPTAEARSGAEKIEETAQRVGDKLEDAARKTGDAVRDLAR